MTEMQKLREFFWNRVDRRGADECWPWTGSIDAKGYGQATVGARGSVVRWRAHRLAFVALRGPIPDGLVVMHSCDNRRCVNPKHLSLGTVANNNDDMMRKNRFRNHQTAKTHCANGHALSGANLRITKRGFRVCVTCQRAMNNAYGQRKRAVR